MYMRHAGVLASILAMGLAKPYNNVAEVNSTCISTSTFPTITVTAGGDGQGYTGTYEVVYDEFCPEGIRPHTYTVTQSCEQPICQTPEASAAPPGFTEAVVQCTACGGQPTVVQTLTFPTESASAYVSSGYIIKSATQPQPTPGVPVTGETAAIVPVSGITSVEAGAPDTTGPAIVVSGAYATDVKLSTALAIVTLIIAFTV